MGKKSKEATGYQKAIDFLKGRELEIKLTLTTSMIGYPYSYGDILTPEIARNNRKQAVSYSVLIPTLWWYNLGFGEPIQSYSSGGNSQPEISRVLEQKSPSMRDFNQEGSTQPEQVLKGTQGAQTALKIPSGGSDNTSSPSPSKAGPGARAKNAAKKDFARRQTGKKPTSVKSSGSIFAEGFSPNIISGSRPMPLPGNFNIPKAPSVRCSANPNDMGSMGRVNEKFDASNAVKKLVKTALKNQDVKNEYARIKNRLEEGVNPADIGKKSTSVASNMVLIKGDEGRYLVEVSGDQVNLLGMWARGNHKNVQIFERLMNEMYDVNLQY